MAPSIENGEGFLRRGDIYSEDMKAKRQHRLS